MTTSDHDRLRDPPAARFAADDLAFDLQAELDSLKAEHGASPRGHRQKTLYKHSGATLALFHFERDGNLPPHKTNGTVTIHVIDGTLRIGTANSQPGDEHILTAGQLLILAPNVQHHVLAVEGSSMLLHVHLYETNADRRS